MNLTLRIGRFTITLLDVEIDGEDDGPAMSATAGTELAPGFAPPEGYWGEEEERG